MSVEDILNERAVSHGDFTDNARTSQGLKNVVESGAMYNTLSSVQKEAVDMILHKLARIVNGDPNHQDSWDDISGYATLVSQRIHNDH